MKTTRIESGRNTLVISELEGIGKVSVSVFIESSGGFTILLDPEDAKVAGEALRRRK